MLRRFKTIVRAVVRDELERDRPQQIIAATQAANGAIENSFSDMGGLSHVHTAVAFVGELVNQEILGQIQALSVAPRVTLDIVEQRARLATQQALACAMKEFAPLKGSTAMLLQHLPGFVNAMASVPALANLVRLQRLEITTLKALNEVGAACLPSIENEVREVVRKVSELEARTTEKEELLLAKLEASRAVIDQEVVEQRHLWEAIARNNVEAGNLWKSAELATREIGNLWQRTEFNRSEILYEMKYGLNGGAGMASPPVGSSDTSRVLEPVVRNPKLIDEAPSAGFKVNLGCGHLARTGYLNVDARQLPGVDVVADLSNLPFSKGTVGEFLSAHVLEHFPQEKLKRLLPYWRSLMKPGGRFCAIVPDGEASLAAVADGRSSFTDFREVLFGGQEYEGDFHFNLFTPDSLAELLGAAQFKNIEIVEKGRKNGNCYEFEIGAQA